MLDNCSVQTWDTNTNNHKRYDPPRTITYRNLRVHIDLPSQIEQHFKRRGGATCAIYQTDARVTLDIAVLQTVDEYTLKSAYHTVKEGSDDHEDLRHPENRSPLREVAVKLLAPRRSSLHSVPQQPIAPLSITSSHLRQRDLRSSDSSPRVHVASSRSRRQDFFRHSVF